MKGGCTTRLRLQPSIEQVAVLKIVLEFSRSSKNYTCNVDPVFSNEQLSAKFCNFAEVIVPFFQTKTCKTQSRLATTTMLFGKFHAEFVDDLSCVAKNSAKKAAISVHDNESKLLVILEQFG